MIERRDTLIVNAGLGGLEEGSEFGRDFVIDLDVGERMGQRREELGGRAIGSHIRSSSARLEGDKVDIIMVNKEQEILIAKVGWDGKPSGEVGSRPLTAMDGVSARGRGGKGRLEVGKTRADAREHRHVSDRAKTRGRDGFAGRGNPFSQGVQVTEGG
jgi:hypothetical protein